MSQEIDQRFSFPWYRKGLHFSCTQCGKCCTGAPGYVWVTEKEMEEMAQFLNIDVKKFKRLYVRRVGQQYALVEKKSQNHSCVFYKDSKCQVYAARPLQCRAYPFWQENLLSEKNWKEAAKECEGISVEAPVVPFEKIEEFLQEQRKQCPEEHFVFDDSMEVDSD